MGYPRSSTVVRDAPGFYHCISRCVRRAWLCGDDPLSKRNFDHRRGWIEERLIQLSDSFAVGLYAWAVMSNHTHVVVRVDPRAARAWSSEEVARRWVRLGVTRNSAPRDPARIEMREQALLADPERVEEIRQRLGSLSWFMRFLNECIAREANAEDDCTGRFWEGRFKCQALLDEPAVLACMAYVDLNPIRAGLCDTLTESDFTTIQRRSRLLSSERLEAGARLGPVTGLSSDAGPGVSEVGYMDFVERAVVVARDQAADAALVPSAVLQSAIRGSPEWWRDALQRIESRFGHAVGTHETLKAFAGETGRAWIRGLAIGR